MKIISLGWGVQSFALAAMSALEVLPPVDAAVHADTGWERAETYAFAEKWTPWLEARGVRVVTVRGDHHNAAIDEWGGIFVPAFTLDVSDSSRGMLRRQCTSRWKIGPIRRWLQANRRGRRVEQWLGFTWDEAHRSTRQPDVKYITNVYPLIGILDRPQTRQMVIRWLRYNNLEVPLKSSCIFCPYHGRAGWREIRKSGTGDWEKALEVDRAIRHKRPGYLCYLTAQRKPLDECDFRNQEDHGQLALWHTDDDSMSAADGEHLPLARQPETPISSVV